MRLVADENFPLPTIEALRQAGQDVTWVRTDHPGATDTWLLDLAEEEGRVLLTIDKDFWQLAIQKRRPLDRSGVVLFRIHPANSREHRAARAPDNGHRAGLERARQRCHRGWRADGATGRPEAR